MEDRDIMEKELLIMKGVCDLYLHGTLEATTAEVHAAFKCALNDSLDIQNKIYKSRRIEENERKNRRDSKCCKKYDRRYQRFARVTRIRKSNRAKKSTKSRI